MREWSCGQQLVYNSFLKGDAVMWLVTQFQYKNNDLYINFHCLIFSQNPYKFSPARSVRNWQRESHITGWDPHVGPVSIRDPTQAICCITTENETSTIHRGVCQR